MDEKNLEMVMGIIMYGGEAKSNAIEAIQAAKSQQLDIAHQKIKEAEKALIEAHKAQTEMLTKEAQGEPVTVSLLLVHAQDHLMTSLTFVDLAKEVVGLYERLENL